MIYGWFIIITWYKYIIIINTSITHSLCVGSTDTVKQQIKFAKNDKHWQSIDTNRH